MLSISSRVFTAILLLTMLSCTANRLGVVRSIEAEKEIGVQRTPAFLRSKGGLYDSAKAQQYVERLTAKLSENVRIPEGYRPIPIRILDTATPSAYALPGGTIYVSRGIIAMSNTEAQLAGVIAHEIGHVAARHSAKSQAANERFILDVIMKKGDSLSRETSEARQIEIIENEIESRLGELTAFSKEQELEADAIAIQILTAHGYGARGYGDLLQRLDRWQLIRAARAGMTPAELEGLAARSGYPKITERVAALGVLNDVPVNAAARDQLMSVIDGMAYEDRYAGGTIRDSKYWNRKHNVSFDLPPEFLPEHGEHLRLLSSKGAALVRFDEAEPGRFDALLDRLADGSSPFKNARPSEINGIPTVTASMATVEGEEEFVGEVVFYDLGTHAASLTLLTKRSDETAARRLFNTMKNSFRRIDRSALPSARTYKARRTAPGDTVFGLAQRSNFDDDREAEFRLLNGLQIGQTLTAGDWIKSVE